MAQTITSMQTYAKEMYQDRKFVCYVLLGRKVLSRVKYAQSFRRTRCLQLQGTKPYGFIYWYTRLEELPAFRSVIQNGSFREQVPRFALNVLPPSYDRASKPKKEAVFPTKRWYLFTKLHCLMSENTRIFKFIGLITMLLKSGVLIFRIQCGQNVRLNSHLHAIPRIKKPWALPQFLFCEYLSS